MDLIDSMDEHLDNRKPWMFALLVLALIYPQARPIEMLFPAEGGEIKSAVKEGEEADPNSFGEI